MLALAAYLFGVAFGLGLLAVPLAIRAARRAGVLDHPGERKVHRDPVPLAGGWAIFGVVTLVVWGHLAAAWLLRDVPGLPESVRYFAQQVPALAGKIAAVWGGALAVFLLGLVDDVRGLSPRVRLAVQAGVATGLAALGYRPDLGFLPPWAAAAIGVLWVVGLTNAFNLLDGLDGLSAGVALVATAALVAVMSMGRQPDWLFYLATVGGALLAFLRYNWHPARIFLGSAGSLTVGYLLAMASLMVTYTPEAHPNPLVPLLTPVFIMAVPLYDTTSVVLIRLLQGRPVATGDRSHFHHRMMKLGYGQPQAVAFILLVALAVALSGVGLTLATPVHAALILAQIVAIFAVLVLAERVGARVAGAVRRRRDEAADAVESTRCESTDRPL
jgi:UDP-GlcNAc:undecaprenyl-phosphate GlcNAc-1-phosphate transferase